VKILFFSEWFSEGMGYSENCLPKALAALGHDVHLVTSNAQIYYNLPNYKKIYEPFLGPPLVSCGTRKIDGFTLYRLPFSILRNYIWVKGLISIVKQIQPAIVQSFDPNSLGTLKLALYQSSLQYKLFTESHIHASVITATGTKRGWTQLLKSHLQKAIGRRISRQSTMCYSISQDAAEVAVQFFGVNPHRLKVQSLGVDTDIFHPVTGSLDRDRRKAIRDAIGFAEDTIVAIYTGRLSEDKNPYCLAQAIGMLAQVGTGYRGLFIGDGPQADKIKATPGCVVLPFMLSTQLGDYYRAADIGVWPKQESTSQLDAACSGLPIIISDRTKVPERIDGNGLTYRENDVADLFKKLLDLHEPDTRRRMGILGSERISKSFSWKAIASIRVADYHEALANR